MRVSNPLPSYFVPHTVYSLKKIHFQFPRLLNFSRCRCRLTISARYNFYTNFAGAIHADDHFYLFGSNIFFKNPTFRFTKDDVRVTHYLCTMWTNFAKTGYPLLLRRVIHQINSICIFAYRDVIFITCF